MGASAERIPTFITAANSRPRPRLAPVISTTGDAWPSADAGDGAPLSPATNTIRMNEITLFMGGYSP